MRLAFKRIQIFLLISTAFIAAINIFVIYLLFDNQLSKNLAIYNTLGLIIMFIIIQFIIAKHIIKLVKAQYKVKIKAEECIQEKAMLIEKMTKGLALVQVKNQEKQDKDLQYSYIITFANEAFQRIVNSERDQIIGKDLFGIVSLKNKYDIEETLIKLLRSEISSRQSELYIEELNKWLTVSVYSYNEANLAIECDDITQSKLLNEKLIKDEETLRVIFDISGEGLWDLNLSQGVIYHNKRWQEIFDMDDNRLTHSMEDFLSAIHPEDRESITHVVKESLKERRNYQHEYRVIKNKGEIAWVFDRGTIIYDKDNEPIRLLGSVADITSNKMAEKEILREKEMSHATLMSVGDGIIATDVNGFINLVNPIAEEINGHNGKKVIGKHIDHILKLISSKSGKQTYDLKFKHLKRQMNKTDIYMNDDETLLETLDGRLIRIAMKLSPISLNDGEMAGFVLAFRDITERYENQKRIEFLSIHDELTGLYNRHHMEGLIREVDIEKNLPITIMVLDIDNLKLANDIFGHAKGDELIKVASDLFRNVFRKEDFISRTGGDEFSVILPRTNLESAERIKSKIYRDADKYSVEPLISSISVGCAVKSSPEEKIVDVIKSADTNMYQDKQANRRPVMNKMVRKFMTYNRDNVFFVQDHLDKVSFYSKALYKVIGKSDKEVSSFASAVRLHDIGKVVVPKEILNKRGKLTDEEFEIVKGHVQASYQILRVMHEYENYAEAILHHHERVDGTGYPDGLVASEIPLESKVIAITNSYEAMTSVRPYRDAMSKRDAIAELKKGRGSQYDSSLVDIFVNEVL